MCVGEEWGSGTSCLWRSAAAACDVEVGHQGRESTGTVTVIYRSNGRCLPYVVRLVDENGAATLTRVDALSTPSSERDDR